MDEPQEGEQIPTVLRLVLLLEELARIGTPATPTELNEALGLPKTTVHRLCDTLEEQGFLIRDIDGRRYTPGGRLRNLATGVLSSLRAQTARQVILRNLSQGIGETCNITIPDGDAMLYLDRVETEWPLRIQLPVGTRVPLYCTASGKLHLSSLTKAHRERYLANAKPEQRTPNTIIASEDLAGELATIRQQGYALDNEEFLAGMVAIAVPLNDTANRPFGTLAIHGPAQRLTLEQALAALPLMRESAGELARLIALDT